MDIHKAAVIIIQNKKLLVTRSKNKDIFVSPGGKLETGETAKQALIRELMEECKIQVAEEGLSFFGTFHAPAAGNESNMLTMDVFLADTHEGEIVCDHEIAEIAWINSNIPTGMKVGSIFEHDVIPQLREKGLID